MRLVRDEDLKSVVSYLVYVFFTYLVFFIFDSVFGIVYILGVFNWYSYRFEGWKMTFSFSAFRFEIKM